MSRGSAVCLVLGGLMLGLAGCGDDSSGSKKSGVSYQEQFRQALKEEVPDIRAGKLIELGRKQAKAKDLRGAETTLQAAAKACRQIKKPASRASTFAKLAQVQVGIDRRGAKKSMKAAQAAAGEIEAPESKARALATLGATQAALKDTGGAMETLKQAEVIAAGLKDPFGTTTVLGSIAESYHKAGQAEQVDRVLTAALATARAIEEHRKQTDALAEVAAVQNRLKKKDAAGKTFALAIDSAGKVDNPNSRAHALMDIAQKLSKTRRHARVHEVLKEAKAATDKIKAPDLKRQANQKVLTLMKELPGPG